MIEDDTPARAAFEAWAAEPCRAAKLPLERWPLNNGYRDIHTYSAWYGWKFASLHADKERAQRQAGPYLDCVETERLTAALTWMGCPTPPSMEAMALDVAASVNRLTRAVMKHKAATEAQRQAGQEPVLVQMRVGPKGRWRDTDGGLPRAESLMASHPGVYEMRKLYTAPPPVQVPMKSSCLLCQGSGWHAPITAGFALAPSEKVRCRHCQR